MLKLRRGVGVVALSLSLTPVLGAACSGGGDDLVGKNPAGALKLAAKRTTADDTVKMSLSASLAGGGMSVVNGTGAYDFERQLGRFTLKALGANTELVITADKVFLKVPKRQPTDKNWVSLTNDDVDAGGAGFLSSLRSQIDPRETLKNLGTTITRLKNEGKEKIRGVSATHLSGHINLSDKAIAAAPDDVRESLRQARDVIGAAGYPVDVWLDADGRVRRIQYAMSAGTGAVKAETTMRLDLYGFGEDAKIALPDPADVKEGLD